MTWTGSLQSALEWRSLISCATSYRTLFNPSLWSYFLSDLRFSYLIVFYKILLALNPCDTFRQCTARWPDKPQLKHLKEVFCKKGRGSFYGKTIRDWKRISGESACEDCWRVTSVLRDAFFSSIQFWGPLEISAEKAEIFRLWRDETSEDSQGFPSTTPLSLRRTCYLHSGNWPALVENIGRYPQWGWRARFESFITFWKRLNK